MTLRDISLWMRSAYTDSTLAHFDGGVRSAAAFDHVYQEYEDPWGANSPQYRYQHLKYEHILSTLPDMECATALDIGCGLGGLTRLLARRCESVEGIDISQVAIAKARQRSTDFSNITFRQGDIRNLNVLYADQFDLIVIADTIYYLSPLSDRILKDIARLVRCRLRPGGMLLLANHFFFNLDRDSKVSRDIHNSFRWADDLELVWEGRRPFFLTSVFTRTAHD